MFGHFATNYISLGENQILTAFIEFVLLHHVTFSILYDLSLVMISSNYFILLHEKFLQFDWLRAAVFQLNLKYLQVKITNLLQVVV